MINRWYWILRALEGRVQRSRTYANSYSILSKGRVDNGGSSHPVRGLTYFFNNAFLLKIFVFSIIVVFDRQWDLHGSYFRWSNMLFREMQFSFPLSYTVIKHIIMVCIVSDAGSFESYKRNIGMPESKLAMFSQQSPIRFSSSGSLKPTRRVKS